MNRTSEKHAPVYILCVEDEPDVLEALINDLQPFESHFRIEGASSAEEARHALRSHILPNGKLGLVLCDHLLPGQSGVAFLVELQRDPLTAPSRKVLITAHAGLKETIEAVNRAGLNYYIAKPWDVEELRAVVRRELTQFVLGQDIDLHRFLSILEPGPIAERIRQQPIEASE